MVHKRLLFILLLELYLPGEGVSGRFFECDMFALPALLYLVGLLVFLAVSLASFGALFIRQGQQRKQAARIRLTGRLRSWTFFRPLAPYWYIVNNS